MYTHRPKAQPKDVPARGAGHGDTDSSRGEVVADPLRDTTLSAEWKRERLLAALLDEVAQGGFERTTPASVAARANLPESEFVALFADVEACFIAAFENVTRQIHAQMIAAYRSCEDGHCAALRAALDVLARALCASPEIARACLLDAPASPKRGLAQLSVALPFLNDALQEMLGDAE